MKSRLLALALLMLGPPSAVFAQESFNLVVETLPNNAPSAVRTGEPFVQAYRIRYLDLRQYGREIILDEGSYKPANLPVVMGGGLELVGVRIDGPKVAPGSETDELIIDIFHTLRIIDPEKGEKVIPKFRVRWAEVQAGQRENITFIDSEEFDTAAVPVVYVSTINKQPAVDIRDEIRLGDYDFQAQAYRWTYLAVSPLLFLAGLAALVISARGFRLKRLQSDDAGDEPESESGPASDEIVYTRYTFAQAYRNFFRQWSAVRQQSEKANLSAHAQVSRLGELYKALRILLSAALNAKPGHTVRELGELIAGSSRRGAPLAVLLRAHSKLVDYDQIINRDLIGWNLKDELSELNYLVRSFKLRWRLWFAIRRAWRGLWVYLKNFSLRLRRR